MLISGFTFVRNAAKLYYPVKASIESILPIVDEFIVALGKSDEGDTTEGLIRSIGSEKIKIFHTDWDLEKYPNGSEYAHQTDIAKAQCKGDWLFYLQSDEVVHEKYLPTIQQRCAALLSDQRVEGLLFDYKHFWGDYNHYIVSHAWYPKEIRMIRNLPNIHSWRDAQSFRRIPNFSGDYFQKENTFKLKVAKVNAEVFHYGWVRPPQLMQRKRVSFETHFHGEEKGGQMKAAEPENFQYGNLDRLQLYKDPQPAVMKEFISKFNWRDELDNEDSKKRQHKHDKLKYRLLTTIEQNLLGGNQIAGFKNYELLNV